MASLAAIGIFLPLVVICFGVGARALRRLRLTCSGIAEEAVFAVPVGMGIVAYLLLALGLVGLLRLAPVLILLAVLAVFGGRDSGRLIVAAARWLYRRQPEEGDRATALPCTETQAGASSCPTRRPQGEPENNRHRAAPAALAVGAFLLVMGALTLLGALTPSGQNDWDALSYHLAAPKIYLQHGRIIYLPWMSHSNFPFTAEMLYALGLMLEGQRLAKLFDWLAGLLMIATAMQLGAGKRSGATVAAILAATPILIWEATTAGNDLAIALYTVLALLALARWAETDHRGWLWASGIACGFALGMRPTALVALVFLCGSAAWQVRRRWRRPWRSALGAAGVVALIACVIGSPWYVKSAVWTGNPVYPFLYGIFDGKFWSAEAARLYRVEQLSFGMGHGIGAFLLYPWNLTAHPQRFFNFPEKPLAYISIAPLYLALIPLLLLAAKPHRITRFLLGFMAVFSVGWFLLSQHIRYFIPVLPAVAVLAAEGALAARTTRALRLLVAGLVGVVGVVAAGIALLLVGPGAPAAIGIESDQAYLARALDIYPAIRYINTALPRDAKVVTLGETRGFYLDREYIWGDPGQHTLFAYDRYRTPAELVDAYAERGFTHVLMGLGFLRGLEARSGRLGELFVEAIHTGRLQLLYEDRRSAVFAIRREG